MSFEIEWHPVARLDLLAIPWRAAARIDAAVMRFAATGQVTSSGFHRQIRVNCGCSFLGLSRCSSWMEASEPSMLAVSFRAGRARSLHCATYLRCSIRPDSSRLDGREAGDVNAHPALRRGSAEGADRASGELHVLGQIGLGHVRVVLIKALHDARCKRRRKLGAKLTEESRGPHEHEATERP